MTNTTQPSSGADKPRRRFFWRAGAATLIAGLAAGIGTRAFAHAGGFCGWQRGGFIGGTLDPAALDAHLDRALAHLYVEIAATDAQKQQLTPIVKAAAQDLLPLRARLHDGRRRAVELLSQPTIDRAALEALRADQLTLAEMASQRFTRALADVADVLTVEQRTQLAERISRWRGHHG